MDELVKSFLKQILLLILTEQILPFFNSENIPLSCVKTKNNIGKRLVSCVRNDTQPCDFFVLYLESGQASLSRRGGSISLNTFSREMVGTNIFQCSN